MATPEVPERRKGSELTTSSGAPVDPGQREEPPRPGQGGLVTLGLALGILLMAVQLWLLAIAFDLYQEGERAGTVGVALSSGLVFLGGLVMLRVLDRHPKRRG